MRPFSELSEEEKEIRTRHLMNYSTAELLFAAEQKQLTAKKAVRKQHVFQEHTGMSTRDYRPQKKDGEQGMRGDVCLGRRRVNNGDKSTIASEGTGPFAKHLQKNYSF